MRLIIDPIIKPLDSSLPSYRYQRSRNRFLSQQNHQILFYNNLRPNNISCYLGVIYDENDQKTYLSLYSPLYGGTNTVELRNFRYLENPIQNLPCHTFGNNVQFEVLTTNNYNSERSVEIKFYKNNIEKTPFRLKVRRNNENITFSDTSFQPGALLQLPNQNSNQVLVDDECGMNNSHTLSANNIFTINLKESSLQQHLINNPEMPYNPNMTLYNPNYAIKTTQLFEDYINLEIMELASQASCNN